MIVSNAENGLVLAEEVMTAHTFFRRLRGKMFTRTFTEGTALHIQPCKQIHTFFMNYAIDVLYLSSLDQVVGMEKCIQPWRIGKHVGQACSVLELPAGRIQQTSTLLGHRLLFTE